MKRNFVLFLVLLTGVLFSSCGDRGEDVPVVHYFSKGKVDGVDFYRKITEKFTEHPNIFDIPVGEEGQVDIVIKYQSFFKVGKYYFSDETPEKYKDSTVGYFYNTYLYSNKESYSKRLWSGEIQKGNIIELEITEINDRYIKGKFSGKATLTKKGEGKVWDTFYFTDIEFVLPPIKKK